MELLEELGAAFAEEVRQVRGTGESSTVEISMIGWETYLQVASYDGDDVLVEVPGAGTFRNGLSRFDEEWLEHLGFNRPDDDNPNWWIGIEGGADRAIDGASQAVVRAMVEVHGVWPTALAEALGMSALRSETIDVDKDPVIREVADRLFGSGQYTVDQYRLWASQLPDHAQVALTRQRGLVGVEFLGPAFLSNSNDDSDWSIYFAMKASGASFNMFPDAPSIVRRIRRAIELNTEHVQSGENPFEPMR